jgi:hypothetical protein
MKTRYKKISRLSQVFLAVMLAALGCGCKSVQDCSLTCKLWENDQRSYCEPLSDPELALFDAASKNDVLVQYSAISDRHDGVLRRSYFLEANRARILVGKSPHFFHGKPHDDWQAIPVNGKTPPAACSVSTNAYATANGKDFTLYWQNRPPEYCQLPDYRDDHNTLQQVALTPLAFAGDVVIFGSVISFVAGYEYLQSGGPNPWNEHTNP